MTTALLLALALSPAPLQDAPLSPEEAAQRLADGWRRQDLVWIPPDEVAQLEAGLWKCGDEWLTLERANGYHAQPETRWRIPGERTLLETTLLRHDAERALAWVEEAYADLVPLFGVEPPGRPIVVALSSREQYHAFTGGDPEKFRPGKSFSFADKLHGAYLADNWFDGQGEPVVAGVAYWAIGDEKEASFGPLWIRHALGQAFVELLDPSPEAQVKRHELVEDGREVDFQWAVAFWDEKRFPAWLRSGAASYAERYYVDDSVGPGDDPLWARRWSVQNIVDRGGFFGVSRVLKGAPRLDQPDQSTHWLNQAGLLVAFVLDGEDKTVTKAHDKLTEALARFVEDPKRGERGLEKAIEGLEKALDKREDELEEWVGL